MAMVPRSKAQPLHPNPDRSLLVGDTSTSQRVFHVSSVAMSMACNHWRSLFDKSYGFLESVSEASTPIPFPEDDPDALLILLRIAHLQFSLLPETIPFDLLVKLSVLCDKYDCIKIVQPFIEAWMKPWTSWALKPGYEQWLFIAWVFGCANIFEPLVTLLVLSLHVDESGNLMHGGEKVCMDIMPPGIMDSILQVRGSTIDRLLGICYDRLDSLVNSEACQAYHDRDKCNNFTLGFLLRKFRPLGIWPSRLSPSQCSVAIGEILMLLANLKPFKPRIRWTCDQGSSLKTQGYEILLEIPSAVEEPHRRHMEIQALKSGMGHVAMKTVPPVLDEEFAELQARVLKQVVFRDI